MSKKIEKIFPAEGGNSNPSSQWPILKRRRVQFETTGPSLTQQQFKEECDLQNILDQYNRTGQLPNSSNEGVFMDLASMGTYQDAKNFVIAAEAEFAELPAKVREKFDNDPGVFLDFVSDPGNALELVSMGLATSTEVAPPVKTGASKEAPVPAAGEGPKA